VLGTKSPEQLASELIDGTKLGDQDLRARLFAADKAAIDASTDPMIVFVRSIDPELRLLRKDHEDNVSAPLTKYSGQIAKVYFKTYGTSVYPDATFTLRISYGTVKGYRQGDVFIDPITRINGLFARATGADPFKLPDRWVAAQAKLNPQQPFNFATTNDIIGGNSGSPVVNRNGEVVGLIFDGNIQSLGGEFGFDPEVNRAVAVSVGALREALTKVYGANRIVEELKR
jgi:Peptidase S46